MLATRMVLSMALLLVGSSTVMILFLLWMGRYICEKFQPVLQDCLVMKIAQWRRRYDVYSAAHYLAEQFSVVSITLLGVLLVLAIVFAFRAYVYYFTFPGL